MHENYKIFLQLMLCFLENNYAYMLKNIWYHIVLELKSLRMLRKWEGMLEMA